MWQRENNAAASEASVEPRTSAFAHQPGWSVVSWCKVAQSVCGEMVLPRAGDCLRQVLTLQVLTGGVSLKPSDLQHILLLKRYLQNNKSEGKNTVWQHFLLSTRSAVTVQGGCWGSCALQGPGDTALILPIPDLSSPFSGESLPCWSLSCFPKLVNERRKTIFKQPLVSVRRCCSLA